MAKNHSGKRNRLLIPIILLIAFLIIGALAGYFIGSKKTQGDKENEPSQVGEQSISKNGDVSTEIDKEVEYMTINTDYGDLYYPEQWNDYLVTEQSWEGENLIVSFSAKINETEYPMFQVTIGDSDAAEVGELTDSSGTKRAVHMSVIEIEASDELSQIEQKRLYAMQEDLNYLIDSLKE